MAVNIARTTIPLMTPATIGPFDVGEFIITVIVLIGTAALVDAVTTFWGIDEGVDVEEEVMMLEYLIETETTVELGLVTEELENITSGKDEGMQAFAEI